MIIPWMSLKTAIHTMIWIGFGVPLRRCQRFQALPILRCQRFQALPIPHYKDPPALPWRLPTRVGVVLLNTFSSYWG